MNWRLCCNLFLVIWYIVILLINIKYKSPIADNLSSSSLSTNPKWTLTCSYRSLYYRFLKCIDCFWRLINYWRWGYWKFIVSIRKYILVLIRSWSIERPFEVFMRLFIVITASIILFNTSSTCHWLLLVVQIIWMFGVSIFWLGSSYSHPH